MPQQVYIWLPKEGYLIIDPFDIASSPGPTRVFNVRGDEATFDSRLLWIL